MSLWRLVPITPLPTCLNFYYIGQGVGRVIVSEGPATEELLT